MEHPWPGNVRELSNLIERMAIIHANTMIDVADLPDKFQHYEIPQDRVIANSESIESAIQESEIESSLSSVVAKIPDQGIDLKGYLSNLEVDLIQQALDQCNGVVAHAAKRLKMGRTTLVEKMRKYEMTE
jgi:sigma-54 specific flagellar transcriptional regulator A